MQRMLRQPAPGMCAAAVRRPQVCPSHSAYKHTTASQVWLRHGVNPHRRLHAASSSTAPPPSTPSALNGQDGQQQQQTLQQQVASLTSLLLASQQSTLHLANQVQQLTTQLGALQQQQLQQQQLLQAQQLQWQQAQAHELEQLRAALQQQQECMNQELTSMQEMVAAMQGVLVEQAISSSAAAPSVAPLTQQQQQQQQQQHQQQQQQQQQRAQQHARDQLEPLADVDTPAAQLPGGSSEPVAAGWSAVTVPSYKELLPRTSKAVAGDAGVGLAGKAAAAEPTAVATAAAAAAAASGVTAGVAGGAAQVSTSPQGPAAVTPLGAAADSVEEILSAVPPAEGSAAASAPAVDDGASMPPPAPPMDARVALQLVLDAYPAAASSDGLDTAAAQQVQAAMQALVAAAVNPGSWSPGECAQVLFVAACSKVCLEQSRLEGVSPEWLSLLAAAASGDPATAGCQQGGPTTFWAAAALRCHGGLQQQWLERLAVDTQRPAVWQGWYKQARPDEAVVGYALAALTHPLLGPAAQGSLQLLKGVEHVVERRGREPRVLLALLLVLLQQGYHLGVPGANGSSRWGKASDGKKPRQQAGAAADAQAVQLQQLQQQLADMAIAGVVEAAQQGTLTAADAAAGVNLLAQLGWYRPPTAGAPAAAAGAGVEELVAQATPQRLLLDAAAAGCQGAGPCSLDPQQMLGLLGAVTQYCGPEATHQLLQQMAPSLQQQLDQLDITLLVQLLTSTAGLLAEVTARSARGTASSRSSSSDSGPAGSPDGPVMEFLESLFIRVNNQWGRLTPQQLVDVTHRLSDLQVPALRGCNVEAYAAAALQVLHQMSQTPAAEGGSRAAKSQRKTKAKSGSAGSVQGQVQQEQLVWAALSPAPLLTCYVQMCTWQAAAEGRSTPRNRSTSATAAAAAGGGGGLLESKGISEELQALGQALCAAAEAAAVARPQGILLQEWTRMGVCFVNLLYLAPRPQFMAAWCKAFQEAVTAARGSPKQQGKAIPAPNAAAAAAAAAAAGSGPTIHEALTLLPLLQRSAHLGDLVGGLPSDQAQPEQPFQAPAAVLKALQAALAAGAGDMKPDLQLYIVQALAELQLCRESTSSAAAVDSSSIAVLLEGARPALGSATTEQLVRVAVALAVWWRGELVSSQWLQEWAAALSTQLASVTTEEHQQLLQALGQISTKGGELPEEVLVLAGDIGVGACAPGLSAEEVLEAALQITNIFQPAQRQPPEAVRASVQQLVDAVLLDGGMAFEGALALLVMGSMLGLRLHPRVLMSVLEHHGQALLKAPPDTQVQVVSVYAAADAPSHPVLRQAGDKCRAVMLEGKLRLDHVMMLGQATADLQLAPSAAVQQAADFLHGAVRQATRQSSKPVKPASKGTPEALQRQREQEAAAVQKQAEFLAKASQVWDSAVEALKAADAAGEVVWPPSALSHVTAWEAYIAAAGPLQQPQQQQQSVASSSRPVMPDELEALQQEALGSMGVTLLDPALVEVLLEQATAFDLGLEGAGGDNEADGEVIDV